MLQRAKQFFRATFARVRRAEYALVEARLSPAQAALFRRMPRCDQRHCLDVFNTLYDAGYQDEALLQAALIHDVGKVEGRLTLGHRVAVVLLERFAPGWLARLAADGRGWKAPFVVHVRHAHLGAQRAARAGCLPDTVMLIDRHHDLCLEDERSAALQWADRKN